MGMFRRMMNIGVGLAAGALAYKVLGEYNKNKPIEGNYVLVDDPGEPAAEEAAAETAAPAQEKSAE